LMRMIWSAMKAIYRFSQGSPHGFKAREGACFLKRPLSTGKRQIPKHPQICGIRPKAAARATLH
jgi:hypothetical protein